MLGDAADEMGITKSAMAAHAKILLPKGEGARSTIPQAFVSLLEHNKQDLSAAAARLSFLSLNENPRTPHLIAQPGRVTTRITISNHSIYKKIYLFRK